MPIDVPGIRSQVLLWDLEAIQAEHSVMCESASLGLTKQDLSMLECTCRRIGNLGG